VSTSRPSSWAPYEAGPWARRGQRLLAHALDEAVSGRDPLAAVSGASTAFRIDLGELAPDDALADWADELPDPP
jgi:hypothetical protein